MKPYYEKDGITIYHGDCREILPTADVMVTDPPFGIQWSRGTNDRRQSVAHDGIAGDEDTSCRDAVLAKWLPRPAILFGSPYAPSPNSLRHVAVYEKPEDAGVVGSTVGLRRDVEMVYFCGVWPVRPCRRGSVFRPRARGNRGIEATGVHPHVKPVDVMCALVELHEGVVIDPFMGSGTTLVAAKQLGRKAIGIEIEERYCEIAVQRLAQGVLPLEAA